METEARLPWTLTNGAPVKEWIVGMEQNLLKSVCEKPPLNVGTGKSYQGKNGESACEQFGIGWCVYTSCRLMKPEA